MYVCAKIDVNVSVKYSFLLIIWLSSQIISMLPVACLCAQIAVQGDWLFQAAKTVDFITITINYAFKVYIIVVCGADACIV